MFNPIIGGWINYYGHYYKSALYPTLRHIDAKLAQWAYWKYKSLRGHRRRARHWLDRVARRQSSLFAHWPLIQGHRLDNGSRMSREAHVRFCESGGVRFPSATHLVIIFQQERDARRVLDVVPKRLAKYGLTLHPEKTRLIDFRRSDRGIRHRPTTMAMHAPGPTPSTCWASPTIGPCPARDFGW
jgi:hypothetical protein